MFPHPGVQRDYSEDKNDSFYGNNVELPLVLNSFRWLPGYTVHVKVGFIHFKTLDNVTISTLAVGQGNYYLTAGWYWKNWELVCVISSSSFGFPCLSIVCKSRHVKREIDQVSVIFILHKKMLLQSVTLWVWSTLISFVYSHFLYTQTLMFSHIFFLTFQSCDGQQMGRKNRDHQYDSECRTGWFSR